MLFKKNKRNTIKYKSNIIQLDDMGYPLLLCIMEDGDQQWIDVNEAWAKDQVQKGLLKILEWN